MIASPSYGEKSEDSIDFGAEVPETEIKRLLRNLEET